MVMEDAEKRYARDFEIGAWYGAKLSLEGGNYPVYACRSDIKVVLV